MIIIGSYAAVQRGILPAWRDGQSISGDIDILVTQQWAEAFCEGGSIVLNAPNSIQVMKCSRRFDLHLAPREMIDLAAKLSGPVQDHFGHQLSVASQEVLWATLYLTAGIAPEWADKSFRDFFSYAALPLELTPDHTTLALMFRDLSLNAIRSRYCSHS
jgi:hypothetical protein